MVIDRIGGGTKIVKEFSKVKVLKFKGCAGYYAAETLRSSFLADDFRRQEKGHLSLNALGLKFVEGTGKRIFISRVFYPDRYSFDSEMGYGKTKTSSVVQDLGKIGLEPLRRGEDEDYAGVEQRIYETPYGVRKTDPHLLHLFARQNGVYKQNDIDSYPSSDALRNARDNIINLMPISLQYGEVLLDNINSFLALSKSFVENFDKEGLSTLTLEVFLKKIDYTLTFSIEAPHEADRISVLTPRWHLAIQKGQSKEGVPVSLTGNIDD